MGLEPDWPGASRAEGGDPARPGKSETPAEKSRPARKKSGPAGRKILPFFEKNRALFRKNRALWRKNLEFFRKKSPRPKKGSGGATPFCAGGCGVPTIRPKKIRNFSKKNWPRREKNLAPPQKNRARPQKNRPRPRKNLAPPRKKSGPAAKRIWARPAGLAIRFPGLPARRAGDLSCPSKMRRGQENVNRASKEIADGPTAPSL